MGSYYVWACGVAEAADAAGGTRGPKNLISFQRLRT